MVSLVLALAGTSAVPDAALAQMELTVEEEAAHSGDTSFGDYFAEDRFEKSLSAWLMDHAVHPFDYVLSKSKQYDWVFLGEYHRIKNDVDLVGELIPALHATTSVRHLALEFLCEDRTEDANQLITSPTYDRGRAIEFFRSQFSSWSYEEYLALFRVAWESNQVHAEERGPFRLVGLNPCPDNFTINFSDDDQAVQAERDTSARYDELLARALEENLLKPGYPALIYTGIAHTTAKFVEYRAGTDQPLPRMGNLVYRDPYKGSMFFIAMHGPFWDAASREDIYPFDGVLDRVSLNVSRSVGFDLVGTPFESLVHEDRNEYSITGYAFGELYDGYIMWRTPLKELMGVTCIADWVLSEADKEQFWRGMANRAAAEHFASASIEEIQASLCSPRPDHGLMFRQRFQALRFPESR